MANKHFYIFSHFSLSVRHVRYHIAVRLKYNNLYMYIYTQILWYTTKNVYDILLLCHANTLTHIQIITHNIISHNSTTDWRSKAMTFRFANISMPFEHDFSISNYLRQRVSYVRYTFTNKIKTKLNLTKFKKILTIVNLF